VKGEAMVFSSLEFLLVFIPVFLVIYFITPDKYKNYILLIASLVFYAYGEPAYLLLMVFSILVNYILARIMASQGKILANFAFISSMLIDFGLLFVFKYYDFFASNINTAFGYVRVPVLNLTLPLGISFYTFQMSSYMIDVYKGVYEVERNVVKFATYVSMFPQLIAGPIVNYSEVRADLNSRKVKLNAIESGAQIFIIGLMFKVLLANNISTLWSDVSRYGPLGINVPLAWLGAWGYSMQLYFDFFGYSLMAIGLGKIIGFRFPKNFNNPYAAVSLTDFWRRWHITLSRWFRDYVYIPLGGNRCGRVRHIFNLIVVWLLTGLWHGADWNFLLWGLCTVVILIIEKYFLRKFLDKSKFFGHIYMLILIPVLWTIFNVSDLGTLSLYLKKMFFIPLDGYNAANTMKTFLYTVKQYWWLLALCVLFATPYPERFYIKYRKNALCKMVLFAIFWVCVYELVFGANNPFLYFRF
jgi:alginate O-acetyltransferase complex protein AlgI